MSLTNTLHVLFTQGDVASPGSNRQLRGQASVERRLQQSVSPPNPDCDAIAQASMYIAADSDFVADAIAECDICNVADADKANAAIQEVFGAVREVYLRDLCVDLRLNGIDIKTNPANDPYRDVRLSSGDVCGGSGTFISNFASYLGTAGNDPSGGNRTTFHLFYGLPNASGSRTIGCAYIGTACNRYYGVGVNEMSYRGVYSGSLILKRNLLAHENGHNYGGSKCFNELWNLGLSSFL